MYATTMMGAGGAAVRIVPREFSNRMGGCFGMEAMYCAAVMPAGKRIGSPPPRSLGLTFAFAILSAAASGVSGSAPQVWATVVRTGPSDCGKGLCSGPITMYSTSLLVQCGWNRRILPSARVT